MRKLILPLLLLSCAGAWAATEEECTFHAPFDGAFDADRARGLAKAAVKGDINFVPGIRGQGILVGGPDTGLSYEAKGNASLEAGTVAVWVKPEGWDDRDSAMRFFWGLSEGKADAAQDGGTFIWLYRFFAQTTYFLVWDSRGYPTVAAANPKLFPNVFSKGEWVHLAGTWNGDEIRFFINGKQQTAARVPTSRILRSMGERFTVGDPNRAGKADTVLDELRLFDRALAEPEIAALHRFEWAPKPATQELTVTRLPTTQKVRVEVNVPTHRPSAAGRLSARVAAMPAKENRVLAEAKTGAFEVQHKAVELSTAGLAPGEYRAVSTLSEDGKPLAETEAPFAVRPAPAWLGSEVGLGNAVPKPWTPLRVTRQGTAGTVACWGPREYRLGEGLFPSALRTPSCDVLAGPIRVTGESGGKPLALGEVKSVWKKPAPERVEITTTARSGAITLSTEQALEFDGLLWTTLKLSTGGPIRLSRLTLEIPLKREAATLMQTGFSYEEAGAVRPWRHRVLADSQVWLGNEEGGLQWTVPSGRNWRNADRNKQLEIVPEEGRVLLRLNLVDRESTFEGEVAYSFGAQLTPVRPHPAGWRMWRITPLPETPGTRFSPFYTEGWAVGSSYPIPKPEWEKIYTDATKAGKVATIYLQPYCIWPGMPDFPEFAAEWRTRLCAPPPAFDPQAPATAGMGVCPRPGSWGDYFVSTFRGLYQGKYREMGWGAVYFDVTSAPMCDNADHGCGYRDESGVWQGEQRYLEHRGVQQRFYRMLQEAWPEKLLFNHESGCLNMMQLAFTHGMVDGEHLTLALPPHGFTYHKILTLDRMRAEYMGHNFGLVPIFLPEFTRASGDNTPTTREFLTTPDHPAVLHLVGMLFLHDVIPWNAYSHPAPYFRLWAVQDAFGWGDDVEFLPYWKNRDLVTLAPADPNVVCTLYRRPGKVLAVVMNNTDDEREVHVRLDLAKLGLPATTASALDAWKAATFKSTNFRVDANGKVVRDPNPLAVQGTEERIPMAGGTLAVQVPKRGFRVLAVP